MSERETVITQQLQELAAKYVSLHSNRTSLITITETKLKEKGAKVVFYVSVFPEDAEGPAIGFLMRKRGECKQYIMENSRLKFIPHVEFILDEGEKNRQRVDELLSN